MEATEAAPGTGTGKGKFCVTAASDGAGRPRTTSIHPFLPPHRTTDEFPWSRRSTSRNLAVPPTEAGRGWTRRAGPRWSIAAAGRGMTGRMAA